MDLSAPTPPPPLSQKFTLTTTAAFLVGSTLGFSLGARQAALVFRAENTHRTPKTTRGWYFYHKSKNYASLLGGMRGGVRTGLGVAAWVAAFVGMQEVVGEVVGEGAGSVVAGLSGAGIFSFVSWELTELGAGAVGSGELDRLSYGMAVTTAKRGLGFGVLFGIGQELVGFVGRKKREVEEGMEAERTEAERGKLEG